MRAVLVLIAGLGCSSGAPATSAPQSPAPTSPPALAIEPPVPALATEPPESAPTTTPASAIEPPEPAPRIPDATPGASEPATAAGKLRALPAAAADTSADTPRSAARGDACSADVPCVDALSCLPMPRGYCASTCGATGTPCTTGGTCVETWRAGELCLASCSSNSDCRASEGYLCDPTWRTCMLPNMGAILPRSCPAPAGPRRDPAFGPVDALSAGAPGIYQLEPSAVITDDGGITAMFVTRGRIADGNVLGVGRVASGVVQLGQLASDRTSHFDPWLAHGAKATLYAVWLGEDGRDTHQEIGFATSTDRGATWSRAIAVHDPGDCAADDGGGCLDKPMVAVGPDPRHHGGEVIYVGYASGAGLRVRASRDGGVTFGKPVTPLPGSHGNLAIGTDGRLHVVMLSGGPLDSFGSADQQVVYSVSADGGASFARPIAISRRDEMLPYFFSNPSIAVDDRRGWLYIVYTRGGRDAVWDLVVAASKDQGKTWRHARIGDDPPCAIHLVPNVALDPTTGALHIAWYDSRGGGRFAHASCPAGAPTCTQLGAINDAPFAALSTERHGAKWLGEYESLIVDDKRRVLHAVWTQPIVEGDQPLSRIFHAAAKLPLR